MGHALQLQHTKVRQLPFRAAQMLRGCCCCMPIGGKTTHRVFAPEGNQNVLLLILSISTDSFTREPVYEVALMALRWLHHCLPQHLASASCFCPPCLSHRCCCLVQWPAASTRQLMPCTAGATATNHCVSGWQESRAGVTAAAQLAPAAVSACCAEHHTELLPR